MAQNITLLGASYTAVPAVVLPKTGGGTAQFDDTTDATAGSGQILSGYSAYTNGAKVSGSVVISTTTPAPQLRLRPSARTGISIYRHKVTYGYSCIDTEFVLCKLVISFSHKRREYVYERK